MDITNINQTISSSECFWSLSLQFKTFVLSLIFILVILLLVFTIIHTSTKYHLVLHLLVIGLLFYVLINSITKSPRYVSVNEEGIKIICIGKTIMIPNEDIDKISFFSDKRGLKKWGGSNGFFGELGSYKCNALGNFIAYVTDWSKSYVIYRKDKKPIVVSVEDPSIFAKFMQKDPS